MKKILTTVLTLVISTTLISQNTMNYEQKISYIIGYLQAKQPLGAPFNFDLDAFQKGVKLAFEKKNIEFSDQEINQLLQEWSMKMQEEDQNRSNTEANKNKAEGRAFLEKNKQQQGVQVTESGLQYKVERMGTGAKPASANDRVKVSYEGKLLDGTVFDSNPNISFGLNQVIRGWTEGVQLMPIGSKFIFYIPSDLAYGDNGMQGAIPPGATLIFTIELFGINE
jgi:FKBP-type peptidyl-prolyl cis-trans isomerase